MTAMKLAQWLLWLAFGLALVVLGTSSGLRLAANGLGCTPWPRCYAAPATAQAVQSSAPAQSARLAHRIAASGFALVILAAIVIAWRRWSGRQRAVAAVLLAVTALLAIIGRYTPSPLPAITLLNVLGGLTLLAATAFLLAPGGTGRSPEHRCAFVLASVLALVAVQAAVGTTISVRSAGAACSAGCGAWLSVNSVPLWNPLLPGAVDSLPGIERAGDALHTLHRLGALLVTVSAGVLTGVLAQRGTADWRPAVFALALALSSGLALTVSHGSLAAAVAHALCAGLLAAALAALAARRSLTREAR
jgi:cytochrome c oxidase assembly protein subunit 15